jgi:hypothetical protein
VDFRSAAPMMPSAAAVLTTFSFVIFPSSELRKTDASSFS